MSDFRVSKQRVRVQRLIFGKVRDGTPFLTTVSTRHEGAETVLDLIPSSLQKSQVSRIAFPRRRARREDTVILVQRRHVSSVVVLGTRRRQR